ncbi:MAG: Ppx/GppA family phosphatase [Bdellovibrionaceae bacterium]|nr:Ppx/GppA family phosphatase [Pseudobdellovibrionaceae bacterium]
MRVAALDLGTNTFLCLIAEGEGRIEKVLADEAEVVRLGQEVDRTGRFHDDALSRAEICLTKFRELMDRHQVDRILGTATSAARDVENGEELFKIARRLKIPLEIIPGSEEARLSYLGACGENKDLLNRLVIDIGGGSTELIVGRGRDLLFAQSLDIGAVRLTERFVSKQPIPSTDQQRLHEEIERVLSKALGEIGAHQIDEVVAVAGTPTSLAAIELGGFDRNKVDGHQLRLERLQQWRSEFSATTVEEKKTKYQLGGRADIIYAGVSILCATAEKLGVQSVSVSTKGLRYGVALELFSRP